MGSKGNYLETKLLDHVLKTAAFTVPTNIYVALSTSDPTDSNAGVAEPSGNNYARVVCNVWNAASAGSAANTGAITFPTASGSWGTLTNFALYDAASSGNLLYHGTLTTSKTVGNGDTPSFAAGALVITED